MIRTNIYLPEPMLLQLQTLSAATGISVAELVRRILDAHLAAKPSPERIGKFKRAVLEHAGRA